ncbi:unnamed protein product [Mytilus edulis]|uniref:Integrase catalytic domain-containing protein n=1 Tax=Mytilus edulis TaxID=6550 RepID=A0A8S3V8R7_MYTED|nr:unnamed protein product [Mytilus edulis]
MDIAENSSAQLSRLEKDLQDTLSRSRHSHSTPIPGFASDSGIITTQRNAKTSVDKTTPIHSTPVGPHHIGIGARPKVFKDIEVSNPLKPHDIQIVKENPVNLSDKKSPGKGPGTSMSKRRDIKVATYDGSGDWNDYRSHFEACSSINSWDNLEKGFYLAASLRGQAQGVLGDLSDDKKSHFDQLVRSLEERFAPPNQSELYRVQLKERKQRASETLPELGQTIRRLLGSFHTVIKGVIAGLSVEAILGLDFLKTNGCKVDLGNKVMERDNQHIPLLLQGKLGVYRVAVKYEVGIDPRSEIVIQGEVLNYDSAVQVTGIIEPSEEFLDRGKALVGKSVVMSDKTVPVRLLNLSIKCRHCGQKSQWSGSDSDHGQTNIVKHMIDTGAARPIKQQPRRTPIGIREEVDQHINDMLERNIIEPSEGPWSSGIVLVRKKDGTTRCGVDYRQLNACTIKDAYPLPRIDDSLEHLSEKKWFSTLDLCSGYWQVEVESSHRPKTAFPTRKGIYQFHGMPIGLGGQDDDLELDIRQLQETDKDLQTVIGWLTTGSKPSYSQTGKHSYVIKSLWSKWNIMKVQDGILEDLETNLKQVVVPMKERRKILEFAHDNRTAAHLGIKKTLDRIKENFYWPGVRGDTWSYIASCSICNKKKKPIPKRKAPMQVKSQGYPMERIAMDILGELPASEKGNKYILVISDYYTKWTESHPMPNMEATTVANILMTEVISRSGGTNSTIIHSDQGSQFESHLFKEMCKLLQIEKTRTTPYHPKSDGMVERFNKTLATMLTGYVNEYHSNLDVLLPYVMMAYRSSQHETTGYTPNRLMLGREVSTPRLNI